MNFKLIFIDKIAYDVCCLHLTYEMTLFVVGLKLLSESCKCTYTVLVSHWNSED